jgi:hypothetical protein
MAGPFIDPSIMLLDPQFTDRFAVVQRVQNTSSLGVITTTNTTIPDVLGIVLPTKPSDLKRYDDRQFGNRSLWIITRYRLNTAAQARYGNPPQQRQPDWILWNGDTFMVVDVQPFTRYGPGWTENLVTSIDSIEAVT